ncbi:MAG: cytochrome P450 [Sandaracinaceae bacterium]
MNKAPGPSSSDFGVRNVYRFATDTLGLLDELKETYGDVARMQLFGKPWYMLTHPDDLEQVFVKHSKVMLRDKYVEILKRSLGMGLLTNDGDSHKRQRKLMAPAFSPRRIQEYGTTMASVGDQALRTWRNAQEINVHDEMSRVTLEVVAEVLFGAGVTEHQVNTVRDAMVVANEFYANSPEAVFMVPEWVPTPRNRRLTAAVRSIDDVLFQIIQKRRRGEPREDLLGLLLGARDDSGASMSDQQLRDEAITLFLAGHETTALALAHTMYLLALYPDIERRLYAEIAQVLDGRLPTVADMPKLVFTERVVKESMRLYPPAWTTGRETAEEVEVGGYRIEKGAQLLLPQWVVHRDPRWFPNPAAFDPDRWADPSSIPRYAYFPFGGGHRVCIGNHFAMMEAMLLLAITVQRYRLELLPNQRLELAPSVTLRPKGPGIRMRVHERPRLARSIRPAAQPAA